MQMEKGENKQKKGSMKSYCTCLYRSRDCHFGPPTNPVPSPDSRLPPLGFLDKHSPFSPLFSSSSLPVNP